MITKTMNFSKSGISKSLSSKLSSIKILDTLYINTEFKGGETEKILYNSKTKKQIKLPDSYPMTGGNN